MGEYFRSESTRGSLDFWYRLLFLKIRDLSPENPPAPLQIHLRLWDASKLENPATPDFLTGFNRAGTSSFGPTSFKPLQDGITSVVLEASETPQPGYAFTICAYIYVWMGGYSSSLYINNMYRGGSGGGLYGSGTHIGSYEQRYFCINCLGSRDCSSCKCLLQ